MKSTRIAIVAALGAVLATAALGQGGPGGRFAVGQSDTPGWSLMTPEERSAHQQKMWSFRSYDECKAYQGEHHQAMERRAKEQGKVLPPLHANACDRMKARDLLK